MLFPHTDPSLCNICSNSYKERLNQLQKYICQMFTNISKNQVLKQMYGSFELQQLRYRKIQQIIKDVLYGQKEQLIQSLIEKNIILESQLQNKDGLKQKNQKLERVRMEYSSMIHENNLRYENDMEALEQKYKLMLVRSLEEYQQEFNRLNLIYQKEVEENRMKIQQLQEIIGNSHYKSNEMFYQQKRERELFIEKMKSELIQKQQIISGLLSNQQQTKTKQVIVYSNEIQLLNQRIRSFEAQNLQLKQRLYLKDFQNNELRSRESRIMVSSKNSASEGQQFILKAQLPDIMLQNQVQLYKLKQEYQTQIFMCHKKYSQQVARLNHQIQRLNRQRNSVSKVDGRDRVGRITHVKKGYGSLMNQFGKQLGNIKKQFVDKQSIRKVKQ